MLTWYSLICNNPSAQSAWYAFITLLWFVIDLYVLKAHSSCAGNKKKRYPRDIRRCMARKKKAWKTFKQNPTSITCRQRYRECVNDLRARSNNYVKQIEADIVNSNNLGAFYRYINKRTSYRPEIGALRDNQGKTVIDDYDRAELFNCHFASVGVVDSGLIPSIANRHCDSIIDTVQFDDTSIVQAINKLKPNLSSGPDGLPPLLFKRLKFWPLAMLFQQLLSVGYVPQMCNNHACF